MLHPAVREWSTPSRTGQAVTGVNAARRPLSRFFPFGFEPGRSISACRVFQSPENQVAAVVQRCIFRSRRVDLQFSIAPPTAAVFAHPFRGIRGLARRPGELIGPDGFHAFCAGHPPALANSSARYGSIRSSALLDILPVPDMRDGRFCFHISALTPLRVNRTTKKEGVRYGPNDTARRRHSGHSGHFRTGGGNLKRAGAPRYGCPGTRLW
jgi:hypothetical protein